uniref:Uncharacterized protein n=1 Tax=Lepeophtheirus salmonis TaxID=72036 RepID=A0A0K2V7W3_LEPSM
MRTTLIDNCLSISKVLRLSSKYYSVTCNKPSQIKNVLRN